MLSVVKLYHKWPIGHMVLPILISCMIVGQYHSKSSWQKKIIPVVAKNMVPTSTGHYFYCNEANISSCVIDGLKCFLFTDTFLICVYHYFTLMIWVKCYFYDLDVTLSLVMKMTAISLNYMISRAI